MGADANAYGQAVEMNEVVAGRGRHSEYFQLTSQGEKAPLLKPSWLKMSFLFVPAGGVTVSSWMCDQKDKLLPQSLLLPVQPGKCLPPPVNYQHQLSSAIVCLYLKTKMIMECQPTKLSTQLFNYVTSIISCQGRRSEGGGRK